MDNPQLVVAPAIGVAATLTFLQIDMHLSPIANTYDVTIYYYLNSAPGTRLVYTKLGMSLAATATALATMQTETGTVLA